jgi:hypothetical protein
MEDCCFEKAWMVSLRCPALADSTSGDVGCWPSNAFGCAILLLVWRCLAIHQLVHDWNCQVITLKEVSFTPFRGCFIPGNLMTISWRTLVPLAAIS